MITHETRNEIITVIITLLHAESNWLTNSIRSGLEGLREQLSGRVEGVCCAYVQQNIVEGRATKTLQEFTGVVIAPCGFVVFTEVT